MRRTIFQENTLKKLIANQYSKEADFFLSFKCMTFYKYIFCLFSREHDICCLFAICKRLLVRFCMTTEFSAFKNSSSSNFLFAQVLSLGLAVLASASRFQIAFAITHFHDHCNIFSYITCLKNWVENETECIHNFSSIVAFKATLA